MAVVDVVLPAYNEERDIRRSVETLLTSLEDHPEHEWRVVVADNASTDRTLAIARELEQEHPGRVAALHIPVKGRGLALRVAWLVSPAEVMAYMDVDLSTDLAHLPELIDPIAAGEADLSYGTRLHPQSQTVRSRKRTFISKSYVFILRRAGGLDTTDAQCGFKAISRDAARALLPLVRDTKWFFDSELLLLAQKNGFRVREVPVRWVEDPITSVRIVRTAIEDLQGVWRMRTRGVPVVPAPRRHLAPTEPWPGADDAP